MPIINSSYTTEGIQADGRFWVHESHLGSDGKTYTADYLADPGLDLDAVLSLRAANIGEALDAQAMVQAEALNFEMPVSKYAFRQRFTDVERFAVDAFNASFESNTQLSDAQKAAIRSALEDFRSADYVHLRLAMPALQMYEALGLIAAGRAAEIGAA